MKLIKKKMNFSIKDIKAEIISSALDVIKFKDNIKEEKSFENLENYFNTMHKNSKLFFKKAKRIKKKINKYNDRKNKFEKLIMQTDLYKKKLREKDIIISNISNNINNEKIIYFSKICYVCKVKIDKHHFFYHNFCYNCGEFNFNKRTQKCDLKGKIALITGGRIKIGYEACLILLRNGCKVITTTRFPKDAIIRFSNEKDFDVWKDNLLVFGIDFRNIPKVNEFCEFLNSKLIKLDILINNAAQTIRRNCFYYSHLIPIEEKEFENGNLNNLIGNSNNMSKFLNMNSLINDKKLPLLKYNSHNFISSYELSKNPFLEEEISLSKEKIQEIYPLNAFDSNNQQIDLSITNSWVKNIGEINFIEFIETQLINSWTPFIIISKLKPLMLNKIEDKKFIINVTAMEGKFNCIYKRTTHVHTNMSKASLNILTKTIGSSFALDNIFVNCVDTGWVSDMMPNSHNSDFCPPLDEIDGAMRILDPIFSGINENKLFHSCFVKDYKINDY